MNKYLKLKKHAFKKHLQVCLVPDEQPIVRQTPRFPDELIHGTFEKHVCQMPGDRPWAAMKLRIPLPRD